MRFKSLGVALLLSAFLLGSVGDVSAKRVTFGKKDSSEKPADKNLKVKKNHIKN